MNKHWSQFLTLSIVHFMAYPETMAGDGPIVETVARVAEDEFFTGIEIGQINDPQVRREVRSILEAARLPGAFGGQSALLTRKLDLNSFDSDMRARAIGRLKECIDQACELGFRRLATLSGRDPGPARRDEAKRLLADSIMQLCEYGRARDVGITLETFDRVVDKCALIGPADEAAEFAAGIRAAYPNFGLMYDLSHQPLLEEPMLPALYAVKDVLVHAHVGNCVVHPGQPGYGDLHPRFGYPGGENDVEQLTEYLRGLFAVGYLSHEPNGERPWVGIEVKPQAGETSALLLAGTKRVWREAWARV